MIGCSFLLFSLAENVKTHNLILKTLCEEKARNREDREQGRKKNDSAIKIQKQVRGFICRRRLEKARLADAKAFMEQNPDWSNLQNKSIFIALRGLLFKYDKAGFRKCFFDSSDWPSDGDLSLAGENLVKEADEVLENVCRALTANLLNGKGTVSTWYCALLCSKDFATLCVQQIRKLIAAISSGSFSIF